MKGFQLLSISFVISLIIILSIPSNLFAIRLKGTAASSTSETLVIPASSEGEEADVDVESSSSSKFNLPTSFKNARIGFITSDNDYLPVLLGVKNGKKIVSVAKAIRKDICSGDNVSGLMVAKKNATKMKFVVVNDSNEEPSYARLSKFRVAGKTKKAQKKLSRLVSKSSTIELNDDCSPRGNATNSGFLGASSGATSIAAADDGDADSDGIPDLFDSDADADGRLNPYDDDFMPAFRSFYLFSNLKVTLERTVNSNTGVTPTQDEVNSLLSSTSTLAIEIKADGEDGESSELDCGSLGYCSSGGTGMVSNSSFPDSFDDDGDGFGTMSASGPANDLQLMTGASLPDINSGDVFRQIVTDSDGDETYYFKNLDFVFKSTPAIKSVTVNPSLETPTTTTVSYPVETGDPGTTGNCISVEPNDGEIELEIVAWRPQRKGFAAIGEDGDFIDIGGSEITIDIPNPPGSNDTRSPNNCSASTYSESDDNLSVVDGKLIDGASDAEANSENTVTFSVNLTECLAESSDTLDAGESVSLGIQFRSVSSSEGSDNAAVSFCVERPS